MNHAHLVSGHWTDRCLEYCIDPLQSVILGSDLCNPGFWDDTIYDEHIDQCVDNFLSFYFRQPVFQQIVQNRPILMSIAKRANPHAGFASMMNKHDVPVRWINAGHDPADNYFYNPYSPYRHAFVWGIHSEICVGNHVSAFASLDARTKAVYMDGAIQPLNQVDASTVYGHARNHPQVDVLNIRNCEIVT